MSKFYGDFERTIDEPTTVAPTQHIGLAAGITVNSAGISVDPTKSSYDMVCETCGCEEIQQKAWMNVNTREFVEWDDYSDTYCPDCSCETCSITKQEWKDAQINIGNKVRINECSAYFDDGDSNPIDKDGIVISITGSEYLVDWGHCTNTYEKDDLDKV